MSLKSLRNFQAVDYESRRVLQLGSSSVERDLKLSMPVRSASMLGLSRGSLEYCRSYDVIETTEGHSSKGVSSCQV
jgi:hypothetical protein